MNFDDKNITIIGLGMEGGSFAIAIKHYINPKNLFAVDIDENIVIAAEKLDVITKGYTDASEVLGKSDIVIMCIYPSLIVDFMKNHMQDFKSGCIITDVAGVKRNIVKELDNIVRDDIDFIPGHPMAGNEFRGFLYADKNIFNGCSYLLTPTHKNKEDNLMVIESLAKRIGASVVLRTDIETHDTMIAYASQLIHVIASSIVNSEYYSDDITLFSGGSFKSATRVANINPDLWTDAFLENKDKLIKQIDAFSCNIQSLKNALMENDEALIHSFLTESFTRSNKHINKFK